jgi:hypothetical protein
MSFVEKIMGDHTISKEKDDTSEYITHHANELVRHLERFVIPLAVSNYSSSGECRAFGNYRWDVDLSTNTMNVYMRMKDYSFIFRGHGEYDLTNKVGKRAAETIRANHDIIAKWGEWFSIKDDDSFCQIKVVFPISPFKPKEQEPTWNQSCKIQ